VRLLGRVAVLVLAGVLPAFAQSSTTQNPDRSPASIAFADPVPVTFSAADGVVVSADFYGTTDPSGSPIILLFHQAGSNAGEYAPIAPRLVALGWDALAVDSRSGASMWGRSNRTVIRLGRSEDFLRAYADLEAALAWASARTRGRPIVAWGSSYTSALVFRLAAEHPEIGAVMAFSPGEYLGPNEPVRDWATHVTVPVFVTSGNGAEVKTAARIMEVVPAVSKSQFVPAFGVHGSSTLRSDRNPAGAAENWAAVEAFLAGLGR
jgi:dienelactone hydrolase